MTGEQKRRLLALLDELRELLPVRGRTDDNKRHRLVRQARMLVEDLPAHR